jgi:hypothetical protein
VSERRNPLHQQGTSGTGLLSYNSGDVATVDGYVTDLTVDLMP